MSSVEFPNGPPSWPIDDPDVRDAIQSVLDDGTWGHYHGRCVEMLETTLAEVHGVAHALTCASGSLAVEIGLRALGVGPGDEVVMSAYDYEPTFLSIHALGALPVLVDVDAENGCLDPAQVGDAFGSKTKVVIASHLHGGVVPMAELEPIARRHGVAILEDAAQATGATIQGRPAGSWGDVGVLSFGGSKLLTAGRGGALLTARDDLHQRLRLALRRGIQQIAPLSELQAAALLPQLSRLPEATRRRADNVATLRTHLADLLGLRVFRNRTTETFPAYYKLGFWFDPESPDELTRDAFVSRARAEGVALDVGWSALHVGRSPRRYRAGGELTHAKLAHDQIVTLYHPILLGTDADMAGVARVLRRAYGGSSDGLK